MDQISNSRYDRVPAGSTGMLANKQWLNCEGDKMMLLHNYRSSYEHSSRACILLL